MDRNYSIDLWKRLIVGFKPNKASKKTLFIILDGVDQCAPASSKETPKSLFMEIIKTMGKFEKSGLQIRILLSCKDDFLDESKDEINGALSKVKIRDCNDGDVRIMISTKMDDVCDRFGNTSEIRE